MPAAEPKLVLAPTQGEARKKCSRTVPKSQMSTYLALASVFLPDNEEPAPTTNKSSQALISATSSHANTTAAKANTLQPTSTAAKTNSLNSTFRQKQVYQGTCPVTNYR